MRTPASTAGPDLPPSSTAGPFRCLAAWGWRSSGGRLPVLLLLPEEFMRRLTLALLLLAALPGAAFAVVFGQPDNGAHPYVATLLFKSGGEWWSCSGTLIAPRVVLTAGHCTAEAGMTNEATFVTFASPITIAPPGYPNKPRSGNGWIEGEAIPHPLYNDYAEFPRTYDIGIIKLKSNA